MRSERHEFRLMNPQIHNGLICGAGRRSTDRGHGSWYFQCSAPNVLGKAERKRQGGFTSKAAATRARDEWRAASGGKRTARAWTVAQWLRYCCRPGHGSGWSEVDLDAGLLFVVRNRTTAGYEVFEGDPKTAAGVRVIALDRRTVSVLRAHRAGQETARAKRLAAGKVWVDSGYVFVRKDGSPLHPNYASTRFRLLIVRTGMPPVRLHELRHGAASISYDAGADLKDIQDLLGHSNILVTADTYTSVLPPKQRRVAEATARLVLAAASRTRRRSKRMRDATGRRPHHRLVLPRPPGRASRQNRRSTP